MSPWSRTWVWVSMSPGRQVSLLKSMRAAWATPPADTLDVQLDRWAGAAGGWERLERLRGSHVRARTLISGVAGSSEAWITRDGCRQRFAEGDDRREDVR